MPAATRPIRAHWTALRRLLALLAVVAQVSLVLSAVGEGREGIGAAPHVEATGGGANHYAHDEARCAACQARTIHGSAAPLPAPLLDAALAQRIAASAPDSPPATPGRPTNPARAPPRVI